MFTWKRIWIHITIALVCFISLVFGNDPETGKYDKASTSNPASQPLPQEVELVQFTELKDDRDKTVAKICILQRPIPEKIRDDMKVIEIRNASSPFENWCYLPDYISISEKIYASSWKRTIHKKQQNPEFDIIITHYRSVFYLPPEVDIAHQPISYFINDRTINLKTEKPIGQIRLTADDLKKVQTIFRTEVVGVDTVQESKVKAAETRPSTGNILSPRFYARIKLGDYYIGQLFIPRQIEAMKVGDRTSVGELLVCTDHSRKYMEPDIIEAGFVELPDAKAPVYIKLKFLKEWVRCDPLEKTATQPSSLK